MREQFDEIKQLDKGVLLNLHRNMLAVKHNAVFVIVNVRGVLKAPSTVVNFQTNDPVVVPGGMIRSPGIALVLHTELTLGITALLRQLCRRNGFRILLRLG